MPSEPLVPVAKPISSLLEVVLKVLLIKEKLVVMAVVVELSQLDPCRLNKPES